LNTQADKLPLVGSSLTLPMTDEVLQTLFSTSNRFLSRKFGIEMTHSFNEKIGGLVEPEMMECCHFRLNQTSPDSKRSSFRQKGEI
jgi:hypothetical protein